MENGVSRKYIAAQFIYSNEFEEICNEYEMIRGDVVLTDYVDQNINLTMYVYRCYTEILQRPAEEEGMEWWCEQIYTGQKDATHVAMSFINSEEFVACEWSNSEFVKILYKAFMGREYDEAGLAYWIEQLEGGRPRLEVAAAFSACSEFQDILKSFGL